MMYITFILTGLVSTPLFAPELTPPNPDDDDPSEHEVDTDADAEEDVRDLLYLMAAQPLHSACEHVDSPPSPELAPSSE